MQDDSPDDEIERITQRIVERVMHLEGPTVARALRAHQSEGARHRQLH